MSVQGMVAKGGRRTRRHRGGLFGKTKKAKAQNDTKIIESMYPEMGAVAHGHEIPVEGCPACEAKAALEQAAAQYRALPWLTRRRTKNPVKTAKKERKRRMKIAGNYQIADWWKKRNQGGLYHEFLARSGQYEDGTYKHKTPPGAGLEWDDMVGGRKRRRGRKIRRRTRRGPKRRRG